MRVISIPVLGDSKNYAYLIASKTGKAAAVDPAEPETVLQRAQQEGLTIDTVLTTHKHWDHAGGNDKMKSLVKGIKVIGGVNDNVQGATETVKDGDHFDYNEISIDCIETPFHTKGHICYLAKTKTGEGNLFTGDTLFVAGCGRFFEGTASDAQKSLSKLVKLPGDTKVWVGHNYTANNLKFAKLADPENKDIDAKATWTAQQDDKNLPTVPSTIEDELAINPFLRVDKPAMQKFAGSVGPVEVMAALRKAKDNF